MDHPVGKSRGKDLERFAKFIAKRYPFYYQSEDIDYKLA